MSKEPKFFRIDRTVKVGADPGHLGIDEPGITPNPEADQRTRERLARLRKEDTTETDQPPAPPQNRQEMDEFLKRFR